ncbi:DUF5009 domain-containing protein [Arcticibacterium luteifluviistationis]|uniref:DUF5009 domain-containing protein n=2 Tax=Arcticibacterium luteifluviistationis TaxID=1784714 RepID=A0A2Z4GDI0_9BACT|nr:DUF5009 domain-containing protein [Arcticibacterium luteifluviistationis]
MFLMMAEVWHLSQVASLLPTSSFWSFLAFNQSHVAWAGCSLHDLIQPSFTFLVGVALPFSVAARINKGADSKNLWLHVFKRAAILVLLGVFLRSMYSPITNWTFEDTLSQIGLGYPILFLLGSTKERKLWIALASLLAAYWLAFVFYKIPPTLNTIANTGVPADWQNNYTGLASHWNKNTNLAWAFDRWFLNLFPRESAFNFNGGGYATLSFIPTLGTMILGLFAGRILLEDSQVKVFKFLKIGGILIAISVFLHFAGINPIVKRIWTPAWTLFSGGLCLFILAFFHWLVDKKEVIKPFNWLKIIGMNSLAAYIFAHTIDSFIHKSFQIHIGENYASFLGAPYQTLISGSVILLVEWLILRWMYKNKIFIKV